MVIDMTAQNWHIVVHMALKIFRGGARLFSLAEKRNRTTLHIHYVIIYFSWHYSMVDWCGCVCVCWGVYYKHGSSCMD